jgi:hypothetical protein
MDVSAASETISRALEGTATQPELLALGFEVFIYGGLLYLLYRCLFVPNHPTLISDEEATNHLRRLQTALFYVPFMGATVLIRQEVFRVFILIMVYKALGEYIEILIPDRSQGAVSSSNASSSSSPSSSSSSSPSGSSSNGSDNKKATQQSVSVPLQTGESKKDSAACAASSSSNTTHYSLTMLDRFVQLSGVALCLSLSVSYEFFGCVLCIIFVVLLCLLLIEIAKSGEPTTMRMMHKISTYWFGIFWIAFPLAHASIIVDGKTLNIDGVNYGGVTLVLILATSWIGDAAAYYGMTDKQTNKQTS